MVAGGWKLEREESDDIPLLADQSVIKPAAAGPTPGANAAGGVATTGGVRPLPPAYTEALVATAGGVRPPPPAYTEALGPHIAAANIEALQQMILKLLPMGFSSEQITAACSALGNAPSEAQVVGWLLNEDTGSAAHVPSFTRVLRREGSGVSESYREWANTEVKLMAMGFTSGQIAAAACAVGSQSLREITNFLLKPDAASVAPAPHDARTQLVRDMQHRLKDFDEVQVDNALEAVGSAAGSGAPDAHELRQWIEGTSPTFSVSARIKLFSLCGMPLRELELLRSLMSAPPRRQQGGQQETQRKHDLPQAP